MTNLKQKFMRRVVQVNVAVNSGAPGVIAEEIGRLAMAERGWESWIAYGREFGMEELSRSQLIRIGSNRDVRWHGVMTRLFDRHGLESTRATRRFVHQLDELHPDIIHLHNIHGYYLDYRVLFRYLASISTPVVWTIHDCWAMTGHCSHFMFAKCDRWRTECHHCPLKSEYPASMLIDRSQQNFRLKRELFTSLGRRLTLVPVSKCVAQYFRESFFGDKVNIQQIYNGIDLQTFSPAPEGATQRGRYVLGVASVWSRSKGLADFHRLRALLPADMEIVLVGLTPKQIFALPEGIRGMTRTSRPEELAELYRGAVAFVNPTWEDNFPTTNIEALACGTPVVTYRTGGSPEAIDAATGAVVEPGDVSGLADAISRAATFASDACRARAERLYDKTARFRQYLDLYDRLLGE
jgi:glycosyltransferase involved in cell wall biosynthesis